VGGKPLWFILLTVCVSLIFGYLFFKYLPGGAHPVIAEQPAVGGSTAPGHVEQVPVIARVDGANLSIPLSEVVSKRIVAFEYSDGTVTVPLMAFVTGEGKLVTSYRMCEPCNSKTYAIDGDRLSCGNCETQWSLNTLEGLQGNCQKFPPEPFPSVIDGDRVVMSIARIKEWKIRL
jgi:ribosomal protein S27AE